MGVEGVDLVGVSSTVLRYWSFGPGLGPDLRDIAAHTGVEVWLPAWRRLTPGRVAHAASHCAAVCAAFSRNVGRNGAQKPQYRSTQGGTPGAPGNLDALETSDVPEVPGV